MKFVKIKWKIFRLQQIIKKKEGYIVYAASDGTRKSMTLDNLLKKRRKIKFLKINFPEALSVLKGAEEII